MIRWNAQGTRMPWLVLGLAVGLILGATGARAKPSEEKLIITAPNDWIVGHNEHQENYHITEYVLSGENVHH